MGQLKVRSPWVVGGLAMLVMTAGSSQAAATEIQHFQFKGGTAGVHWFDGVNFNTLGVTYSTAGAQPAFLIFTSDNCDDFGCCGLQAFGSIPANAVHITPGGARINVSVANTNDIGNQFFIFQYTYDYATGTLTETPIAGGVIDVTWQKRGPPNTKRTETTQSRSGAFFFTETSRSTFSLATASGSILNLAVPATAEGEIATSAETIISVSRN
jgi:hypothetical protein